MKIYIDDGFAAEHRGGIGVYSDLVYTELKARGFDLIRADKSFLKVKSKTLRRILYTLYLNFLLPRQLQKNRFDIAHFTNFQVPLFKNGFTKYISTVHDISPILFPGTVPWLYAKYFKLMLKIAVINCDRIITVSDSVKKELVNTLKVPEHLIKVCYSNLRKSFHNNGIETNGVLKKFDIKAKEYFLFVGRLEKRKNLITLIRGFEKFKAEVKSSAKLVLVGSEGFGSHEIHNTVKCSKCKNDIILTGYIPDQELAELYSFSSALLFPSLDEGFGLPLFEAMSFNLPIILSKIPTNLEILDSRAFFFEKESVLDLKKQFQKVKTAKPHKIDYSDILKKYSLTNMIDLHFSVYQGLKDNLN